MNQWDEFNEIYGTVFTSTKWMDLVGIPYRLHYYYKGKELIAALVDYDSTIVKLMQYHGITLKDVQYEYSAMKYFAEMDNLHLINHYSITDVRSFLWQGYKPILRYTYIVKKLDLDKDTRYELRKAEKNGLSVSSGSIEQFWNIYKETFERKKLKIPVDLCWFKDFERIMKPKIFMVGNMAGVAMITDQHRDYYIFGASTSEAQGTGASTLALSTAITRETDLVGCNSENTGLFKRGFTRELRVCLGIE